MKVVGALIVALSFGVVGFSFYEPKIEEPVVTRKEINDVFLAIRGLAAGLEYTQQHVGIIKTEQKKKK